MSPVLPVCRWGFPTMLPSLEDLCHLSALSLTDARVKSVSLSVLAGVPNLAHLEYMQGMVSNNGPSYEIDFSALPTRELICKLQTFKVIIIASFSQWQSMHHQKFDMYFAD